MTSTCLLCSWVFYFFFFNNISEGCDWSRVLLQPEVVNTSIQPELPIKTFKFRPPIIYALKETSFLGVKGDSIPPWSQSSLFFEPFSYQDYYHHDVSLNSMHMQQGRSYIILRIHPLSSCLYFFKKKIFSCLAVSFGTRSQRVGLLVNFIFSHYGRWWKIPRGSDLKFFVFSTSFCILNRYLVSGSTRGDRGYICNRYVHSSPQKSLTKWGHCCI